MTWSVVANLAANLAGSPPPPPDMHMFQQPAVALVDSERSIMARYGFTLAASS